MLSNIPPATDLDELALLSTTYENKMTYIDFTIIKMPVDNRFRSQLHLYFIIIIITIDRLVGLVVSISDYWSWRRGFDPRHFHKF